MRCTKPLLTSLIGLTGLAGLSACSTGPAGIATANVVLSADASLTASVAPAADVRLSMGDVPASAITSITLNVTRIDIHVAGGSEPAVEGTEEGESEEGESSEGGSGWITLDLVLASPVDLLDLAGTAGVQLAGGSIPAGKITQVRLFFDVAELTTGESIDVPGQTLPPGVYEVTAPSAQNTGLKIHTQKNVADGETETVDIEIGLDATIGTLNWNANGFRLSPVMHIK
jgi:hypothetical protein